MDRGNIAALSVLMENDEKKYPWNEVMIYAIDARETFAFSVQRLRKEGCVVVSESNSLDIEALRGNLADIIRLLRFA